MPSAGNITEFALFQRLLIGTWSNDTFGNDEIGKPVGGPENPLSYNIMPMPQVSAQPGQPDYPGYILKNFRYYETVRFNNQMAIASPATASNRGGRYTQNARALFYDQQVKFAKGPQRDCVVHVENGAWLYLRRDPQQIGPYDQGTVEPGLITPQPSVLTLAKQITVPHGNSVLALGSFDVEPTAGSPQIPDAAPPYPTPDYLSVEPYATPRGTNNDFQNPDPDFAQHPNQPLQLAVSIISPNSYIHWHVTTKPLWPDMAEDKGTVTNIPFEQRLARVIDYWADYWLLSKDSGQTFDLLAYTQTMLMEMIIKARHYVCPHVTCNTVTRQKPSAK
jgi:hypothetical protein